MNVLVIEHEKIVAQKIKDLLYGIDESIRVVGISNNMFAAAQWLDTNTVPDIILANKAMMAELGTNVRRDIRATVTLSTTTEEFKFQAFRYKTIRHILNEIKGKDERILLPELHRHDKMSRFISPVSFKERFLVKQGQKLLSVSVDQVAYFFSQERFIFFKTFDNQKFLLEYRIEQLETMLSPDQFFRVNRSFIISLPAVKEIHAYFGNRLKLYISPSTDKEVIVSRKRVGDFKEWLGK